MSGGWAAQNGGGSGAAAVPSSSLRRALASASGSLDSSAPDWSAWYSRERLIASWMSPAGVAQTVQLGSDAIDWPFDLTQPDEAREFYRRQCAEMGGAMIAVEVIEVAGFD